MYYVKILRVISQVCYIEICKSNLCILYRWLHGSCDGLVNEEELDCAADHGYHCLYCRPKTKRALVGVSGMSYRTTPPASNPFLSFLSSAGTNSLHG